MAFVRTSGTHFTLNGRIWFLYGGSTYDITSNEHDPATIDSKIAQAIALNCNTIRIVNYMGHSLGWNGTVTWEFVDLILDKCRLANIKVIFDLSDWSFFATASSGLELTHADTISYYYQYIDWVFARVNTVNGRVYKDDDTIAIISIAGEVENTAPNDGQRLHDFYLALSIRIKATGAQQLVHAGGQKPYYLVSSAWEHSNHIGDGQSMLEMSSIDLISVHSYDTYEDWLNYYPTTQAYTVALGKPWFIEEFGYNQSYIKNDRVRSERMKLAYVTGRMYGSVGFSFWNLDLSWYNVQTDTGGGYGISPFTPLTADVVKRQSKYTGYTPREPVSSVNPPNE